MAAARAGGGLHSLRNIEAGIQGQLADQRADLQDQLAASARGSEESALRRAEALLAPPLAALRERVDAEIPCAQRAIEAAAAESRRQLEALRAELGAEAAQLRGELGRLRGELPQLSERIRRNADAISAAEGVNREQWSTAETLRSSIQEAVGSVTIKLNSMAERAAEAAEKRWSGPLRERLGAVEAALREVDMRSRHEASAAMDSAKVVQELLLCRIEEVRLQASQDSHKYAMEAAAGLREEVLKGDIIEKFQQRLHESAALLDARVADVRAQLSEKIEAAVREATLAAEQGAEARVARLASHVAEAVEETHRELGLQAQRQEQAMAECRGQVQDVKATIDAAEDLTKTSLEGLRGRTNRLADEAAELREGLGQTRRAAHDDASAVRAELQERTLRWRTFEEVSMPALVAQVERKTGESEGRSVKAALDYAERLRRLPPPSHVPAARGAPDSQAALPQLTPVSARKPRPLLY